MYTQRDGSKKTRVLREFLRFSTQKNPKISREFSVNFAEISHEICDDFVCSHGKFPRYAQA